MNHHSAYPLVLRKLVSELTRLPAIGEKSALRLAYHMVTRGKGAAADLAQAITAALEGVRLCRTCFFFSEGDECSLCANSARNHNLLCVVEKPADVMVFERSRGYSGVYHVLHGLWSPLRGIRPDTITLPQLISRVEERIALVQEAPDGSAHSGEQVEVILATGTTIEGDATALYIADKLQPLGVRMTRLAQGLPKGGELEFADEVTLLHALEGRKILS